MMMMIIIIIIMGYRRETALATSDLHDHNAHSLQLVQLGVSPKPA